MRTAAFLDANQRQSLLAVSNVDGASPLVLTATPISSTQNALDVNIASGSLTVINPSVAATGSAVPTDATYVGGNKAGNLTGLLIGQQTMASSLAVVIASDQSAYSIKLTDGTNTASILNANSNNMLKVALYTPDGTALTESGGDLLVNVQNFAIGTYGNTDATAANLTSALVFSETLLYNGSTFDRARTASIGDGVAATGIAATAIMGYDGVSSFYRINSTNATADALSANGVGLLDDSRLRIFNGTTWDRLRSGAQTGTLSVGGAVATNTNVSSANYPVLIAGSDYGGTPKIQSLKVDSSGLLYINNISGTISLPTGAATSANQTNASQKTQIVDGTGNVIASTSNALNINISSGSIPSGSNTIGSVKITDGTNTASVGTGTTKALLASIHDGTNLANVTSGHALQADITSIGGTTANTAAAGTLLVGLSDGSGNKITSTIISAKRAIDVNIQMIGGSTAGTSPTVTPVPQVTSYGTNPNYQSALTNTKVLIKGSQGNLYFYRVYNPGTAVVYIQLFDASSTASVTLGVTAPTDVIPVPGAGFIDTPTTFAFSFSNGLVLAATTTASGSTAPSSTLYATFMYV